MDRRDFVKSSAMFGSSLIIPSAYTKDLSKAHSSPSVKPLAITMWDFSWLERRWPGAGYEDWDRALSELVERGYNAIRIDVYPHLIATNPTKEWILKPVWSVQHWGAPGAVKVQVQPALNQFLEKCAKYKVKVAISTWYREDTDNVRMNIKTPQIMAQQWIETVKSIEDAGLLDTVFCVDLCNEWPGDSWAPFFTNDPPEQTWGVWYTDVSMKWMQDAITVVREAYPSLPVSFSFDFRNHEKVVEKDLSFVDFADPHIWMAQYNRGEFYKQIGYNYDRFNEDSYNNMAQNARRMYLEKKDYWDAGLRSMIQDAAQVAQSKQLPLITTECWGPVDYKDWPMLEWDWVKELCSIGTIEASKSAQWLAIATSNFCGPQFKGMWRDIQWHQTHTDIIKTGKINPDFKDKLIHQRL
ncbi:cellulase-like family protein [Ningiella sp. W23]|uniref:cellulase-like family protein n=1 Tax=Ningiella sp. W23 TaxID=3023715 RepID=UPI003756F275